MRTGARIAGFGGRVCGWRVRLAVPGLRRRWGSPSCGGVFSACKRLHESALCLALWGSRGQSQPKRTLRVYASDAPRGGFCASVEPPAEKPGFSRQKTQGAAAGKSASGAPIDTVCLETILGLLRAAGGRARRLAGRPLHSKPSCQNRSQVIMDSILENLSHETEPSAQKNTAAAAPAAAQADDPPPGRVE